MPVNTESVDKEQFMAELERAPSAALLLDYDGTLSPFTEQRHRAIPYAGVAALVKMIMDAGTRVVLITGRPSAEVVRLLGIHPHPEVWGLHGRQRLRPDGTLEEVTPNAEARQALAEAIAWVERCGLRRLAELKPGGIALHWRGLPPDTVGEIRNKILLMWMPLSFRSNMALLEFDGGVELRLEGRNKADAVRTILSEMDEDAAMAFLGDDQSDEQAFLALRQRGLTVLVRPQWRPTAAEIWLKPPRELLAFLNSWLRARRVRRTA